MPESLKCPSCQAPLDYTSGAPVINCAYCGTQVIVPESARPRAQGSQAPTPAVMTSPPITVTVHRARKGGGLMGCVVGLITLSLVLGIGGAIIAAVAGAFGAGAGFSEVIRQIEGLNVTTSGTTERTPLVTATPSLAREILSFGGEGTGVGKLDDAREIAIDGAGNLYVADYLSSRVQRFDQEGAYQGQWNVLNDLNAISELNAGPDGTLLINQASEIHRYNGATGEYLGSITYESDTSLVLQGATALPDGGMVLNEWGHKLVWLDPTGAVVRTADVPERERGSSFERLAVDGQGNLFVLGRMGERGQLNDGVFRYDTSGQYLSFFGGSGDQPGQFRAPNSIAVDSQGRVFVSDINGVHAFDPRGRYLATIEVQGVPFDIAFDGEDHLWVSNREQLFQLELAALE